MIVLDLSKQIITIRLKGLGASGIELRGNNKGQTGFEVLFRAGGGGGIWYSAPVASATGSDVVLPIPQNVFIGSSHGAGGGADTNNTGIPTKKGNPVPVAVRLLV